MSALRRVLAMPGWIAVLVLSQLALAAIVGGAAKASFASAMGNFALPSPDRLLITFFELVLESTSTIAAIKPLLTGTTLLGAAFWLLMVGGIIRRLDQPVAPASVAASAVRHLPAMLIVTLWHLPLRLLPLVALSALRRLIDTPILEGIVVILMLLWLLLSTCALDLARSQIVLHDASRKSPMTAIRGFLQAFRRPAISLPSIVLSTCQWLAILALPWLAIQHSEMAGIGWLIRLVALIALVLGLWRLSVAVGAGPYRSVDTPTFDTARTASSMYSPTDDRSQPISASRWPESPEPVGVAPASLHFESSSPAEQPAIEPPVIDQPPSETPPIEQPETNPPEIEPPPADPPIIDEPPDPDRPI